MEERDGGFVKERGGKFQSEDGFYYWEACKGVSASEIAWQHGRDVKYRGSAGWGGKLGYVRYPVPTL